MCWQVEKQERQRVFLAAQTLSETVGKAIHHCFGEQYKRQAEFVIATDRAFDVFNSRRPLDSKKHRCGFGMAGAYEEQHDSLQTFTRLISESRVGQRQCRLPFQDGFVMSSNALRGLHSALCQRRGAELRYILTSRLTQDFVENFFSQVKKKLPLKSLSP